MRRREFGTFLAAIVFAAAAGWIALPKPELTSGVDFSRRVYDRNGNLLRVTLTRDEKYRVRTPLKKIASELVRATLLHEDRFFYLHPAVNPISAARSALSLLFTGGSFSGASTISMQLARMRFKIDSRSCVGKVAQMFRAIQLERHYSKHELLEAYLNLAPYGANVEGVGAAALLYFGKSANELTLHEAVTLSVIPQSPARRAPGLRRENMALTGAYQKLLRKLGSSATGFAPQVETEKPFFAPHFSRQMLLKNPESLEIHTTLDLNIQRLVERRIADYVDAKRSLGISNAAALLVDFRSMDVLAHVGSADFFDADVQGQVDGTRSRRSPGSTLKPFIYALAMDQGLIHPRTMLADVPRSFGEFDPENFDRDFVGPLNATQALVRSRNVPAVELCGRLEPGFHQFLTEADVQLTRDEAYYGLTLALGGAEVTMEELITLYAALANHGTLRSLRRSMSEPASGRRIVSAEAAFLTLQMLAESPRPGMSGYDSNEAVAWKTGTSHGFRDAWSVAVFDRYVLAVWVGNFDGKSNPAFLGRTAAGPLLFAIIDAIRAREPKQPLQTPANANLCQTELCAVTGFLPDKHCPDRANGWFIPGVSPIVICDLHREVLIDAESALRVECDDGGVEIRREVFEFWPSEFQKLFAQAGLPRKAPPPTHPAMKIAPATRAGNAPRIISPREDVLYAAGASYLMLNAQADSDARKIFWFAGKRLLGISAPGESLAWKAAAGDYELIAMDEFGRADAKRAKVISLN